MNNNWLLNDKFVLSDNQSEKKKIKEISPTLTKQDIRNIFFIVFKFSKEPWTTQKDIAEDLKISKEKLIFLNSLIRNSNWLQDLITNHGLGKKYWKTILPFAKDINFVIEDKYRPPRRIAIYPGLSCMYYCGFCGRNQKAKYDRKFLDKGIENFKNIFDELTNDSAISISGGLEPFTNPKLGEIIKYATEKKIKVPLITNGHSATKKILEKNPEIFMSNSIRISVYGYDEQSYGFITRNKSSYKTVIKNCIDFLNLRNIINKELKFGINFIILKENFKYLDKLIKIIELINSGVKNGNGIDFICLRDDFDTVTGVGDKSDDLNRAYKLKGLLSLDQRKILMTYLNEFDDKLNNLYPEIKIDYGYSLYSLKNNVLDLTYKKITDNEIRKNGQPQLSLCADIYGNIYLYREAGFLDRPGNKKFIIGKMDDMNNLEKIVKNFLDKNEIKIEKNDVRFLDPFDHLLTTFVNQAENDLNFGIPFKDGPVLSRNQDVNISVGNQWYA